ncbi:MAG: glycosyltransferase, partial [Parvibaculales bacterium]
MSNRFQMPSTDAVDLTGRTILQVVPELETGGAEITTMEMAEAIVQAGGRALVASEGGALESRIEAAGGEIVHVPVASKNPLTLWRNVGRLARLMQDENVDLIHGRSRAPCWSALFAAKRTDRPYLATYHSKVHARPRAKVFYNSVMTRGQLTIANSHFTATRIAAIHHTPETQLRVIPRGCDPDALNPSR